MNIESVLKKHCAALGDSPAGVLASVCWREIMSRYFDVCVHLRLHCNNYNQNGV